MDLKSTDLVSFHLLTDSLRLILYNLARLITRFSKRAFRSFVKETDNEKYLFTTISSCSDFCMSVFRFDWNLLLNKITGDSANSPQHHKWRHCVNLCKKGVLRYVLKSSEIIQKFVTDSNIIKQFDSIFWEYLFDVSYRYLSKWFETTVEFLMNFQYSSGVVANILESDDVIINGGLNVILTR